MAGRRVKKRPARPRLTFRPIAVNGRPIGAYTAGGTWQPTPTGAHSSVTVLGARYQILYHTRIYSARTRSSGLAGLCHHHERVLILDPNQPPHELLATAWHEVGHAVWQHGRTVSPELARMSREVEEELCRVFERAIVSIVWS